MIRAKTPLHKSPIHEIGGPRCVKDRRLWDTMTLVAVDAIVPDLSIVLPARNEAGNLALIVAKLGPVLARIGRSEIIFVDDGSSDGTLAEVRAASATDPSIRYVSFTRNFGHEAALRAGLRFARGRAVVTMDADLEHPPELVAGLVEQWRAGFKVVVALRQSDEADLPWFKRVTSRLYYRLLEAIGDVRVEPGSSNYMLLDRVVVDMINGLDNQDLFLRGFVRWLGYPLATVPYRQTQREHGQTKYSLNRMVDLAVTGVVAHGVRPLRFAIWLALGFAGVGVVLVIYSILSFLFVQQTVAGWTSIMGAIALLGAAQLLVLGIVGEYVGRTLREIRKRPNYIVAETEADRHADAGSVKADGRRAG
jgi:glycosyltransferase involved in cell wall biosynthesis